MAWSPILDVDEAKQNVWQPILTLPAQPSRTSFASQTKIPEPEKKPGLFSSLVSGVSKVAERAISGIKSGFSSVEVAPKSVSNLGTQTLEAGWRSLSSTIEDAGKRLSKAGETLFDPKATLLQKGVAEGEMVLGLVNALFSPITSSLGAVSGIPVVGQLADKVNQIFAGIAGGASEVANGAVDDSTLSQETKDLIKPLVAEASGLVAIILAGKGASLTAKGAKASVDKIAQMQRVALLNKDIMEQLKTAVNDPIVQKSTALKVQSEGIESKIPIETSKTRFAEYNKSQGYEPVTPTEKLPVIQVGKGASSKSPIFQTEAPAITPSSSSLTWEPILEAPKTSPAQTTPEAPRSTLSKTIVQTIQPKTEVSVEIPKAEAQTRTQAQQKTEFHSRVYERMKQEHTNLEGNLDYDPIKLKEDVDRAVDLIEKNKQEAFDIALGAKESKDVTSTAVNIALTEQAFAEGNNALAARLIKKRSLDQTRRGQEISAERGSVTDNSTSTYVKQLIAARLDALGKGYFSDLPFRRTSDKGKAMRKFDAEVKKVEKQIRAKKLDTKTAMSLLDQLTCI